MRVEHRRLPVAHLWGTVVLQQRREVIEDDAHLHAAVGRVDYVLHQQLAGLVLPPEVVLEVEGVLGGVHQREAPAQRVFVRVERAPGGSVDTELRMESILDIGQRAAGLRWWGMARCPARHVLGQRGASGQSKNEREREDPDTERLGRASGDCDAHG